MQREVDIRTVGYICISALHLHLFKSTPSLFPGSAQTLTCTVLKKSKTLQTYNTVPAVKVQHVNRKETDTHVSNL